MTSPTWSILIPSYQRRESVLRLLMSLADAYTADPAALDDTEVVVVLDGSTDASRTAIEELTHPLELRVHWQPNRGRAAARNAALDAARAPLVWFLDDDVVVPPTTPRAHRSHHAAGRPERIVLGPVRPNGWHVPASIRDYYDAHHRRLSAQGTVASCWDFLPSNTSGPTHVFRSVGAFDETFVGYGIEDLELGWRLLARGIPVVYEPEASVRHHVETDVRTICRNAREEGMNLVRFRQLHPDAFHDGHTNTRLEQLLVRLHLDGPRALAGVARASRLVAQLARPISTIGDRALRVAAHTARLAGVGAADPAVLRARLSDARSRGVRA